MADPKWFVEPVYLANKAAQLNAMNEGAGYENKQWTPDEVLAAFSGMTAYEHFLAAGNTAAENVSPSPYFVVADYLANKAAQLNAMNEGAGYENKQWTPDEVLKALGDMSAWDHYNYVGYKEGIDPSASFDTEAYYVAKAEQLNSMNDGAGYGELGASWTADDVKSYFEDNNINPMIHYATTGINEELNFDPASGEGEGSTPTGGDLTIEDDPWIGTEGDDVVNGVAANMPADKTLNPGDTLDGLGGADTLNVTLNANFSGFTAEGAMKNIEKVVLTNEGTTARTFNAANISGVESYELNGKIKLQNVADKAASIVLNGQQDAVEFAFADVAEEDALNVTLNGVGLAATEGAAAKRVALTNADAFGSAVVTAMGENVVDLSGLAASKLVFQGEGSVDGVVGAAAQEVDGAALTGNLTLDASDAQLTSFVGGAGSDVLTIAADVASQTANIDGGAGEDTLILAATATKNAKYTIQNVENFKVSAVAAPVNISAENIQGLTSLTADSSFVSTGAVQFSKLGDVDMSLVLDGSAGSISLDHTGSTAISVNGTVASPVTVANSNSVVLDVAEKATLSGTLSADKATDVTINAMGALNAAINAGAATSITFSAVEAASTVTLNADKLTDLNLSLNESLTLNATAEALANLNVTLGDDVAFGSTGLNMAAAESVIFTGSGDATLGALGTEGAEGIYVSATGLNALSLDTITANEVILEATGIMGTVSVGNVTAVDSVNMTIDAMDAVTLGDITAAAVTIDASEVMGALTNGTITADTVTFAGSGMEANTATVTATGSEVTVDFDGGLDVDTLNLTFGTTGSAATANIGLNTDMGNDVINVTAAVGTGAADIVLTGDLGAGEDTITFDGLTSSTDVSIDLSGLSGYETSELSMATSSGATYDFALGDGIDTVNLEALTVSGVATVKVTNLSADDSLVLDNSMLDGIEMWDASSASDGGVYLGLGTNPDAAFAEWMSTATDAADTATGVLWDSATGLLSFYTIAIGKGDGTATSGNSSATELTGGPTVTLAGLSSIDELADMLGIA